MNRATDAGDITDDSPTIEGEQDETSSSSLDAISKLSYLNIIHGQTICFLKPLNHSSKPLSLIINRTFRSSAHDSLDH